MRGAGGGEVLVVVMVRGPNAITTHTDANRDTHAHAHAHMHRCTRAHAHVHMHTISAYPSRLQPTHYKVHT